MNWPIDTLTIHRFRALSELVLAGAGRINLLVGDNNSGKTSVLEAISTYCAPLDARAWRDLARRRVRGFRTISSVKGVTWLFPHGKDADEDGAELFSGEIAIDGSGRTAERAVRAVAQESEEIVDPEYSRWKTARGPREGFLARGMDISCQLTMAGQSWQQEMRFRDHQFIPTRPAKGTTLRCELISPFDHGVEELYTGPFRRAVLGDHKAEVIEALRRIDPGIRDMEFLPLPETTGSRFSGALYLRHAESGRTPLSAFGDGVRRVLLMALTLVSASGGDLLIDEIETAIHISALGGVFQWLVESCQSHDVQLFATTHSLEALDAILAAGKDHLESIVGYRFLPPEQAGPPKRYEGEQLSRLRFERGLDVR